MKLLHELHSQTKKKNVISVKDLKQLWSYVMLFLLYYKEENSGKQCHMKEWNILM